MANDWCICNIGTGHASDERDNLLVKVFEAVRAAKINDGPGHKSGDLIGNLFGHGLESRLRDSMASIPAGTQRVFLVGHNVRSACAIVMENDNAPNIGIGNMFQLTFVANDGSTAVEYIPMPGTHGSATQVNMFNPIGMAAWQMVLRWLNGHKVSLKVLPAPDPSLCNIFFEIHAANPVQGFTASGGVGSRLVTDWDSKKQQAVSQSNENRTTMLAKGGVSHPFAQGGDKARSTGVFINQYHADLFRRCYPASSGLVLMSAADLGRTRIAPGARQGIRREVELLRAFGATWKVLTSLGLADRLERASRDPH